jgi:hypothetical protein
MGKMVSTKDYEIGDTVDFVGEAKCVVTAVNGREYTIEEVEEADNLAQ